ncbi:hypothetical protein PG993_009304 [Apiospora rasikravindrae]|uniref:Uncharacterized protein n=1 Tax=Apiospora rasikravindrae TaxID=990691 RepID=A0ABR1SKU8_9PEZI
MSDNTAPETPVPTMLKPDEPISDLSAQSPCVKDTPVRCGSTQDTVSPVKKDKEPQPAGGEDGPSRPITPKPASTWPKTSKEDAENQVSETQLAKDKVLISARTMSPAQDKHDSNPLEAEEGSLIPIAPSHESKSLTKEETQRAYQREIKAMTRSLKVREIQRMLNSTPSNEAKFTEF